MLQTIFIIANDLYFKIYFSCFFYLEKNIEANIHCCFIPNRKTLLKG